MTATEHIDEIIKDLEMTKRYAHKWQKYAMCTALGKTANDIKRLKDKIREGTIKLR